MNKNIQKHCMVVHAYYPIGEPRVQREAEALKDHGYEVDVICLRQPGEAPRAVVNQVNVIRLSMHRYKGHGVFVQFMEYLAFFWLAFFRLTSLYFQRRYRVIQVHNLPDFLVFVAFIPHLMGAKVILDLHDLMPEFSACRFGEKRARLIAFIRLQERLSCKFADHVITVSEHWRQALIARGVPPTKCSVVMNVADQNIFHSITDIEKEPNKPPNRFTLIYHGAIVFRYGLDLVIQAVALVKDEIPNIRVILMGKGEYIKTLVQLTLALGLSDYISIYDEMRPREELPGIISSAQLGIVAYRNDIFTDSLLPTKLMEYSALNLPAIASRTTAINAYFKDTMVEFFEPGNVEDLARCIRLLYQNPARLQELAQGCERFNSKYNWAKISSDYVDLVSQLGNKM